MPLQVEFNPVPPLPDDVPSDVTIPNALDVMELIKEHRRRYDYAVSSWNMYPMIDNFKRLIIHKLVQRLNIMKTDDEMINMDTIMKESWEEYMDPNLDIYQIYAVKKKYTKYPEIKIDIDKHMHLGYFFNCFFHFEMYQDIVDTFKTAGWDITILKYDKYDTEGPNIFVTFPNNIDQT